MSTGNYFSAIDLPSSLTPELPEGDDLSAASSVLNAVLDATDLSGELRDIAERFVDDAPRSATYVQALSGALARTVLDWISDWPS